MGERERFPVTLGGATYDLHAFMRQHPGGVNTLQHYKGKSIDHAMAKFEHSTGAYHLLRDLRVPDSADDHALTGGVSESGRILTVGDEKRDEKEIAFLEELERRVDWSRPLLGQLAALGADYAAWVHSPVLRPCRLFASPLLEALTYTPWYVVPLFWLPLIFLLLCSRYHHHVISLDTPAEYRLSSGQFAGHVAAGGLLWTLIEYSAHRWLFHFDPGASHKLQCLHFLIHGVHHKVPFDSLRQVFPPVPLLALVWLLYQPAARLLAFPAVKLVGVLAGYLAYDLTHCYVHAGAPSSGSYMYAMKRYHAAHHFNHHDKAFGVSCKLWDLVFQTFVRVRQLAFDLRW